MGGYDPAKDPRNKPGYRAMMDRAGGVNRNLKKALEDDVRNGHVAWGEMQQRVERAEQIRDLANQLAGADPTKPANRKKAEKLEKLAGGKGKAKKAIEDATIAAGAKESVLRKFMRGW